MTHHGNLKKTGIGPRDFGGEPNIPSIEALFTGEGVAFGGVPIFIPMR